MDKWIRSPSVCFLILAMLCLLTGLSGWALVLGGLLYVYSGYARGNFQYRIGHWPTVPATILACLERKNERGDIKQYSPMLSYEYQWQGQTYRSSRISARSDEHRVVIEAGLDLKTGRLGFPLESDPVWGKLWWRQLHKGQQVPVYINPQNPEESYLFKTVTYSKQAGMWLQVVFGLFLVVVGLSQI